ncbi:unnamed protein product [Schistosoma turkestanicum]|nr:unnamed protein product [Schistosoma turkestanicum]
MSFILKLFIILYFRIGYLFLYAFEMVPVMLTKFKSSLLKPTIQSRKNDMSLKSVNLPDSKNLLGYEICIDYAINLLKTNDESNVMKAIEVILYVLKDNKLTKLQSDCLYHLAVGFLKLNDYHNATIYSQCLLTIEPGDQKIKNLLLEIKSRSYKDTQNNFSIKKLSIPN